MQHKEIYPLSELVMITGLTDRTLRNYIASGILQGEKVKGQWQFTQEQVQNFTAHPAVRPSIQAKQNAIIYDFLLENHKDSGETCIILDCPGEPRVKIAEFFCRRISSGEFQNIRFAFDGLTKVPRVILSGYTQDVLRLVNEFTQK